LHLRFIAANEVEKMPCVIQWPMNHVSNCKNYFSIYFGMPLKMDIRVLFIFIKIKIDIRAHSQMLGFQKKEDIWSFFTIIFTNNYTR
jgi:hypothetical protein